MISNLTIDREEICDVIYWDDLTEAEQAEFDYLDTDERQEQASFARYRDNVYDLGEFMAVGKGSPFGKWQGYASDSSFSGILIKYENDDFDLVIMATYYS